MNKILTNLIYWFVSSLQMVLMKVITAKYFIDNIIFNSFFKIVGLPYYIYKLKYFSNEIPSAKWYDVIIGILDQMDILLTYMAFSGLTIGVYVTIRTLSLFFGGLYLIIWYKKLLPVEKLTSIGLILIACGITLLGGTNNLSIFHSLICIVCTFAYSIISFIIEVFVKTETDKKLNFYWSKIISCVISLFIGLVAEYSYQTISKIFNNFTISNQIIIIFLELTITLLENLYYYYKIKVISQYNTNGSIIAQFLDIMRRFTLIICGIAIFSETYDKKFVFSLFFMFLGCIAGMTNFKLLCNGKKTTPLMEIKIITEDSIKQIDTENIQKINK